MSKFIEAARQCVLDQLVQLIKDRNSDVPPEELEARIDEAMRAVRTQSRLRTSGPGAAQSAR